MSKIITFFSNLIWILLGGLLLALLWCVAGIVLCVTVIGIPFGVECFKAAWLSFMPYGKKVTLRFSSHPIANILWLVLGGWELTLVYLLCGIANCITVIGISRGLQCFKIMKLALFPFGASVQSK